MARLVTVAEVDPLDPGSDRCKNCGHRVQRFHPGGKLRHPDHVITCGEPTWEWLMRAPRVVVDVPVGDLL